MAISFTKKTLFEITIFLPFEMPISFIKKTFFEVTILFPLDISFSVTKKAIFEINSFEFKSDTYFSVFFQDMKFLQIKCQLVFRK